MKHILSVSLCLCALLACQEMQSQKEIVQKTKSGYRYEIFKDVPGPVLKAGNFALIHARLAHGDSTLSDTRINPGRPTTVKIEELSERRKSSSGPVQDLLELLSVGDSARLYYPIDSFKMKPQRLKDYKEVTYDIKVLDVFNTEEDMKAYYAAERAKADSVRSDMQKQEADVADLMTKFYNDYKSGKHEDWKTTESGLKYTILTKGGTGVKAHIGDVVHTHYYGIFEADGKPFDSSYHRGETLDFAVGKDPMIKGFEEAFQILEKGDKAILLIPSNLAYGSQGYGDAIPPNSALFFYVDLIGVGDLQ